MATQTSADRQKAYRDRKRNAEVQNSNAEPVENVTKAGNSNDVTPNSDKSVTVAKTESALSGQKQGKSDLAPAQSINDGCHSKSRVCGACGGTGWLRSNVRCECHPAKTGKSPCQDCGVSLLVECDTICSTTTERPVLAIATDPLHVYSPDRWAKLQTIGYIFDTHRATRKTAGGTLAAPPVPGDPAYGQTVPTGTIG